MNLNKVLFPNFFLQKVPLTLPLEALYFYRFVHGGNA